MYNREFNKASHHLLLNKILIGTVFLLLLSSCLILEEPTAKTLSLTKENCFILNGIYTSPIDTFYNFTIADHLILEYQAKYGHFDKNDSVECKLKMHGDNQLEVLVLNNGEVEMGRIFEGEIINNYFYFKKRQKYVERYFGIILRLPEKRKTRIALDTNRSLIVESKTLFTSSMFFIPGRHYFEVDNRTYCRIK